MRLMTGDKTVSLSPGFTLELEAPVYVDPGQEGTGFFIHKGPITHKGIKLPGNTVSEGAGTLVRGFFLENYEVGSLAPASNNSVAVVYTHLKPFTNVIYFQAVTGERGMVSIVAAPIHDHSSIVQGGPAYGTYFRDINPNQ